VKKERYSKVFGLGGDMGNIKDTLNGNNGSRLTIFTCYYITYDF
jgi:hypothetical protein